MRAVTVDDSAEDRLNLRTLLARCRGLEVVGEAPTLQHARDLLAGSPVDLLFLDIQLGRENGFDLLKSLQPRPQVIVTTVHRQYGVRAFDHDVADYLVKPVTDDRLQRALRRAEIAAGHGCRELERIVVHRSGSARELLAIETIVAVTAEDKYSRVASGSREYPDHRTLREWEEMLGDRGFVRIDRSTLVDPARIVSLQPVGRGARLAFRHCAVEIEIGRAGRERLEQVIAAEVAS
jgi:two-component system, LytTR family, response regulator